MAESDPGSVASLERHPLIQVTAMEAMLSDVFMMEEHAYLCMLWLTSMCFFVFDMIFSITES